MEAMTEAMHLLAVKTKQETVSMRVITLVTLFFLPGTFISVRYLLSMYRLVSIRPFQLLNLETDSQFQTVMSTDIVKFPSIQESGKVFQLEALQLFLAITLPLMAVTFIAWWVVYWCVNRRQDRKTFGGRFSGWLP